MGVSGARRHPVYRDDNEYANSYTSCMPGLFLRGGIELGVPFFDLQVLMAVGYHQDIINAAGDKGPTFADDIYRVLNVSVDRAKASMLLLKKAGLLEGSAAAGYTLR